MKINDCKKDSCWSDAEKCNKATTMPSVSTSSYSNCYSNQSLNNYNLSYPLNSYNGYINDVGLYI